MDYRYDVFLSYNRKFPHGQWVEDIFYPLFIPYLGDALNREAKVFKDTEEIESGSSWPQRLRNALAHSRCMVSIFSPSYFRSQWCMKEFAVMYHRQMQYDYLTVTQPNGLILPVNIFDGEHFPGYALELQMLDCIQFNLVGDYVKKSEMYLNFQRVLQEWVYDVAKAIQNAPPWEEAWLKPEWLDIDPCKLPLEINMLEPFVYKGVNRGQQQFQPNNKITVRKPNL